MALGKRPRAQKMLKASRNGMDVRRAAEFSYSETLGINCRQSGGRTNVRSSVDAETDGKMNALRLSNERHRRALDHFRTVGNVSRAGCEEFCPYRCHCI